MVAGPSKRPDRNQIFNTVNDSVCEHEHVQECGRLPSLSNLWQHYGHFTDFAMFMPGGWESTPGPAHGAIPGSRFERLTHIL
jgi:hypothetical protein